MSLNTLEQSDLLRKIAWLNSEVDKIKRKLSGEQISSARIKNLTWDKAQGGTATLGGVDNGDGLLNVKNINGDNIVILDKDGIQINNGKLLIKNDSDTLFIDEKGIVSSVVFGNNIDRNTTNPSFSGNYGPTVQSSPSLEVITNRINTKIMLFLTVESFSQQIDTGASITSSGISFNTYENNILNDYILYGPFIEYEVLFDITNKYMDNVKTDTRTAINVITLEDIGTYDFRVGVEQSGSNLKTTAQLISLSALILGQ